MGALIGPIIAAASALVSEVVDMVRDGKEEEARAKVERFVAATKAELAADKQGALDILHARFGHDDPYEP